MNLTPGTIVRNRKNGKLYTVTTGVTYEDEKSRVRVYAALIKDGKVTNYVGGQIVADLEVTE